MKRIALSVALLLASVFSNLSGQSSPNYPPASQIKMTTYVLGIIRKGPNWGKGTEEDSKHIQEGHLENIRKMAAAGKLIVAGPLADDALRGIFIFGVSSIDEAKKLVGDDPAVKAGRLVVDYYQWYAAVGLKVDLQTVSQAARHQHQPVRNVSRW